MIVIVISCIIALGVGLMISGAFYEEEPKKKAPDYVVMADDGDDE